MRSIHLCAAPATNKNVFLATRFKRVDPFERRVRPLGSISYYLLFLNVLTFSVILRSVDPGLKGKECPVRSRATWTGVPRDFLTRKKPSASREYPTFIKTSHPPLCHGSYMAATNSLARDVCTDEN